MTKVKVFKFKKNFLAKVIFVMSIFTVFKNEHAFALQGELTITRVAGSTHFEFNGLGHWDYEIKKTKELNAITLTIPRLKDSSKEKLLNYTDNTIQKVEFLSDHFDHKEQYKIYLTSRYIETFDYLTESPLNLAIDFFKNEKNEQADNKKAENQRKIEISKNSKKQLRQPAASEFFQMVGMEQYNRESIEDLLAELDKKESNRLIEYNFEYFKPREESVIESQGNIYLKFPMLSLEKDYFKTIRSAQPEYEIKSDNKSENTEARFLLNLFQKKRYAAFLEAKKVYMNKYPKTKYKQILGHMDADALLSIWEKNKDIQFLNDSLASYLVLVDQYPESPLRERTLLLVALLTKYHVNEFTAIKSLKRFIDEYKESPFNYQAQMLLADSYTKIKSYNDALKVLEEVKKNAGIEDVIEATYRIGDIYFSQEDYITADKSYAEAMSLYPEQIKKYPNALFNSAESEFIMGNYKASLVNHGKFIKNFPQNSYGGYSMTRVGELLEIMGYGDKMSRGFLNESQIKYRNTQGGKVAKVRLLSQKMKDMTKENEISYAVKSMRDLIAEIKLQNTDEFVTFMISDGYYGRGDFKKSYQELISYFQKKPKPNNREKFEKRIAKSLTAEVKKKYEQGDFVSAINEFESNENTWLKKIDRIDLRYFYGKSYEKAGLYEKAERIYEQVREKLSAAMQAENFKERKVIEMLPTNSQINLRQASIDLQNKKYTESLRKIANVSEAEVDSSEVVEKIILNIENLINLQDWKQAIKNIDEASKKFPDNEGLQHSLSMFNARALAGDKKFIQSVSILEKLLSSKVNEKNKFDMMKLLFTNYKMLNKSKESIDLGMEILNLFPNHPDISEISFSVGDEYYKSKKYDDAKKLWTNIKPETVWKKIAESKIDEISWKEEFDTYVDKIPAMNKRSKK